MLRFLSLAGAVAILALAGGPAASVAAELKEVWRVDGLKQPESIVFDPATKALYLSNVEGEPTAKDGKGYISKLSPDGKMLEAEWVKGLQGPKGLGISGDRLYVADIDRLVAIDIAKGEIAETYDVPEANFLNDIAIGKDGRVFMSDTGANTIYVLDDGKFGVWLKNEDLSGPNGLLAEDDRLVVAAWGEGEMMSPKPSHLKTVDLKSKSVATLGDGSPVGNLDGIEPGGKGSYLVTDWVAGALFRIEPSGKAEKLLDLNQGSADLLYRPEEKLVLIPMMQDGLLLAYRLE